MERNATVSEESSDEPADLHSLDIASVACILKVSCADPDGEQGVSTPPEKSQKYTVS